MHKLWPPRLPGKINYITDPPRICGKRNIVVMGSTGSIGRNALAVASASPKLAVLGLACGQNIALLREQAIAYRPRYLAVSTKELAQELGALLPADYHPEIFYGMEGYREIAGASEADSVLSAQAGSAGLAATLAAALAGKMIALANKESLVVAGEILRRICAATGASILPVDSEHFALFQCLSGRDGESVRRLVLTASGGPFRDKPAEYIYKATPAQALRHPNWSMGAKISIDSATLMNKGLEFIEAMHLFGVGPDQIRILLHPQSIIHSLVEFRDHGILGQFAVRDMRLPIGSCLCWPWDEESFVPPLDLTAAGPLTFEEPDLARFPCLAAALAAARFKPDKTWQNIGLNPACIVLNAANEKAVEAFLQGKCAFGKIAELAQDAIEAIAYTAAPYFPDSAQPSPDELYKLITELSAKAAMWVADRLAKKARKRPPAWRIRTLCLRLPS